MLLADAEKLALELMAQFGLIDPKGHWYDADHRNWRFEFDDAVRRFGCCWHGGKKITLSRELTLRNEQAKVEDTIRHEIAHALCPAKAGHGPCWKAACKRTGAKPERCYRSDDVDAPQGDWTATCRGCGAIHHKFRRPKRDLYCARKECKRANPPEFGHGRFNAICKLVWRHKNALPEAEPNVDSRRKAIEAMKARLKAQEPESDWLQCVKCDSKSLGSAVCPGCGGELKSEKVLQAEKEALKKRIAELERKGK